MSVATSLNYIYSLPIGVVLPFLNTNIPDKFLLCDGSAYDKVDYPFLSEVLVGIYGEDANTFNVPNLVGKFISGTTINANQTTNPSGNGSFTTTITEANMPSLTLTGSIASISAKCDASVVNIDNAQYKGSAGSSVDQSYLVNTRTASTQPNYNLAMTSVTASYTGTSTPITKSVTDITASPANYQLVYIIKASP
jgi:hypothetical protein